MITKTLLKLSSRCVFVSERQLLEAQSILQRTFFVHSRWYLTASRPTNKHTETDEVNRYWGICVQSVCATNKKLRYIQKFVSLSAIGNIANTNFCTRLRADLFCVLQVDPRRHVRTTAHGVLRVQSVMGSSRMKWYRDAIWNTSNKFHMEHIWAGSSLCAYMYVAITNHTLTLLILKVWIPSYSTVDHDYYAYNCSLVHCRLRMTVIPIIDQIFARLRSICMHGCLIMITKFPTL